VPRIGRGLDLSLLLMLSQNRPGPFPTATAASEPSFLEDQEQRSTQERLGNGPNREILLAMTIDSDIKDGGASRGSISPNYENLGKNPSVYPYYERLFGPALRGYGLPFQRVGDECAGFA
jgi:hypothetical protein